MNDDLIEAIQDVEEQAAELEYYNDLTEDPEYGDVYSL